MPSGRFGDEPPASTHALRLVTDAEEVGDPPVRPTRLGRAETFWKGAAFAAVGLRAGRIVAGTKLPNAPWITITISIYGPITITISIYGLITIGIYRLVTIPISI